MNDKLYQKYRIDKKRNWQKKNSVGIWVLKYSIDIGNI